MQAYATAEIGAVREVAGAHEDRIPEEVANQDAETEEDQSDVGGELAGFDGLDIEVRRDGAEKLGVEEAHQSSGNNGEYESAQGISSSGLR